MGTVGAQPAERELLEVAQELGKGGHRRDAAGGGGAAARLLGREEVDHAAEEPEVERRGVDAAEDALAHAALRHPARDAEDLGQVEGVLPGSTPSARAPRAGTAAGTRGAARARARTWRAPRGARCAGVHPGLDRLQVLEHLGERRREDRAVQPALAAEVVADQRLVDTGARGDRPIGTPSKPCCENSRVPASISARRVARESRIINQPDG